MGYRDRPLIPRAILLGNPDRALVHLSPDGAHLAWLAPLDGVLNVWVAPRDDLAAAHPVTHDTSRSIRVYTFVESVPPYWKADLEILTTRLGDHRTEAGSALLSKLSPLTYVNRICRPLLIGHGANDPRAKQAESDQIVTAMQAPHIPVTYVLYPDEGHGFARSENTRSFIAIAEAFLAKCLGCRCEPIGHDFEGSSLTVPIGAQEVPGLVEALAVRQPNHHR
jgi:acetyl esterase/lipase